MKTLEAHEQSLSKIFSDDYVFSIPGYQRPYSWTTEQAGELLFDLIDFISANSGDIDSMPPYFLGSIVLIKKTDSPGAEVVDGQQRITTLTLLLSAIRHQMAPGLDRDDISGLLLARSSRLRRTENRYRLTLRDQDKDFFREYVQDEDSFGKLVGLQSKLSDSQTRLQENASLFQKKLSARSPAENLNLAQFIVNCCYIVTVCTPDMNSAFRIFSVLNSRGLDLSATDILKSTITGKIPEKTRGAYTKKWEELEEMLGRDPFAELFSHIRMIYRKAKSKGTLLKEFEEHVQMANSEEFIEKKLTPLANIFREITESDCRWNTCQDEINEILGWINRIGFSDWMPPALAFIDLHSDNPEKAKVFLADLERLIYSMLIRKAGVNERIERFSKLTTAVEADADLAAGGSPLQLTQQEIKDTKAALEGPIYNTHSAQAHPFGQKHAVTLRG
jgi:uncharacterized protein with ParB-like and HNH nuclease domain